MIHVSNSNTRKSVYCTYIQSVIKSGIISWGNSSNTEKNFTLQKKIVIITSGAQPSTSHISLFKELEFEALTTLVNIMSFCTVATI